jgi:hypothetical protein
MAVILGIIAIKWPEIMRFYHDPTYRSAEVNLNLAPHFSVPGPATRRHPEKERGNAQLPV